MAMLASSSTVFTIIGNERPRGRRTLRVRENTPNPGVGMRWKRRIFFEISLSRESRIPLGLQPV